MRQSSRRRTIVRRIGWAVIALGLGVTWMGGKDWRRGLTTNHAAITEDADDAELRSPLLPLPPEEVSGQIRGWVARQSRWTLVSSDTDEHQVRMHLTRQTRIFRFTDDVRVKLSAEGAGTRLTAESQSRVGKGDLGQNARNLKELLQAVLR